MLSSSDRWRTAAAIAIAILAALLIVAIALHMLGTDQRAALVEQSTDTESPRPLESTREYVGEVAAANQEAVTAGDQFDLSSDLPSMETAEADPASNASDKSDDSKLNWTRSRGLTNALLNRRSEFIEFAHEVYHAGLRNEREIERNNLILSDALQKISTIAPTDGILLCSASICFYDLYGDAETARRVLRQLNSRLAESQLFRDNVAYIREGRDLFRFYIITEEFPISRFFED